MFDLNFSVFSAFLFILLAVLLFLIFRIIDNYLPAYIRNQKLQTFFNRYFALFEFLIWVLFSVFSFYVFLDYNQYFAIVLLVLMTVFAVWSARLLLIDYITGIIIKTNQSISVGDDILLPNVSGIVTDFTFRTLELETDEMEIVYIPYSHVYKQSVKKRRSKELILGRSFELTVAKKLPVKDLIKLIHEIIICTPWVSLKKESLIELKKESNSIYTFEITVYTSANEYISEIKSTLSKKLS